eukprot:2262676-Pyramimonas_sp.AAC.1
MQGASKASNIMTSRYVCNWKFVRTKRAGWNAPSDCAWCFEASWALKPSTWKPFREQRGGQARD